MAMKRIFALLLFATSMHAAVPSSPSKAELQEWLDEALQLAAKTPPEQRRDIAMGFANGDYDNRTEEIKAAVMVIAFRPQFYGPYRLLQAMSTPRAAGLLKPEEIAADEAAATQFIEETYRARMGTRSAEALDWQSGLADFLASVGRWKEALPLQRAVTAIDASPYSKVFLAVLEKFEGNDAPYAEIMANCPPPPEQYAHMGSSYCVQAARSIVQRMAVSGPLSRVAQEILTGRAAPMDWGSRMHGMHTLVGSNPDDAEKELRAILADAKAPAWVKDDAVAFLTELATARQDHPRLLALTECFLTRRGATFPPVTAETWQQLIMMEPLPADRAVLPYDDSHVCAQHDSEATEPFVLASGCTTQMLTWQLAAALNTKNIPAARRAVERMASVVVTHGAGIANLNQMFFIYGAMTRDDTVSQFAALLPGKRDEVLEERLNEAVRKQTKRINEPWTSPTQVTSPAQSCP